MTQTAPTNEKQYRILDGTYFDQNTPTKICDILNNARHSQTRLHIRYGDIKTGRDWLEQFDCKGCIGRSTGTIKIPLLIKQQNSIGGGGIPDNCIVKISETKSGRVLYEHPLYHYGEICIKSHVSIGDGLYNDGQLVVGVYANGELHASFETREQAEKFLKKIGAYLPS